MAPRVTTNTVKTPLNMKQVETLLSATAVGSTPHGDGTTDVWAEGVTQASLDGLLGPAGTYVADPNFGTDPNKLTLTQRAQNALTTNSTYLAIATPTNAQVTAQVAALTRQSSALIRLSLQQFDSTAGT